MRKTDLRRRTSDIEIQDGSLGFAFAWTAEAAVSTWFELASELDLKAEV